MEISLDEESLKVINLFERVTRARIKDCIIIDEAEDGTEGKIIFVVQEGQLVQALGNKGENVKKLRELLKKSVDIIEYCQRPERFVRNIFHNYRLEEVEIQTGPEGRVAHIQVRVTDKGRVIGKGGRNLNLARKILARHHDIVNITLE